MTEREKELLEMLRELYGVGTGYLIGHEPKATFERVLEEAHTLLSAQPA